MHVKRARIAEGCEATFGDG
jgi:hypothetical protein